jgi:VIT1/CCC1 family predicted Fe2+/Mn2+ transporter
MCQHWPASQPRLPLWLLRGRQARRIIGCNTEHRESCMNEQTSQLLKSLQDEKDGVALYRGLAGLEKDPKLAAVYLRMAQMEQKHAGALEQRLRAGHASIPPFHPSFRTRALIELAKRLGVSAVLPSVMTLEQTATHDRLQMGGNGMAGDGMAGDERSHARVLQYLTQGARGGMSGASVAQIEGRHRSAGGNALRAAVLGANDGLVSNLSLVMGVAGASMSNSAILITGLAGLLAGACSMALGEWLSVQSSRESVKRQLAIEKTEIATSPEEEAEELSLIYQARGLDEEEARKVAGQILGDHENALDTLAREELGIDPEELGGSAWEAAITSFILFTIGAIVPVFPYIFLGGLAAVAVSLALSAIALFIIGAGITLFTGRSVPFSGTRQVIFGLTAAAITFGVGKVIGVSITG